LSIKIPVSPGELLDKLTILTIKAERLIDVDKKLNVTFEMILLSDIAQETIKWSDYINEKFEALKKVNEELWDVEEEIRSLSYEEHHSNQFIGLARSVIRLNDTRTDLKRVINLHLGSELMEEKSY